MCNSENQTDKNEKNSWPSARGVFIFMGIVFSLTMAFLIVWPLVQNNKSVHKVEVQLLMPKDSISIKDILTANESNIEELITSLDKQSREISEKYDLLIKSQETESNFFKLVSCIAAFIAALLGFLGYRTIKDIEDRVEKSARIKAEETSRKITEEQMAITVAQKLNAMVADSLAGELIRSQIMGQINKEISKPIEDRIETQKRRVDLLKARVVKLEKTGREYEGEEQEEVSSEDSTPAPDFAVPEDNKKGGEL